MFCMQCGNKIEDGDRFCEFCGALQEVAPQVTQSAPEVQPQAAAETQAVVQPQAEVQPQVVAQPQPQVVQPQAVVQPQPQVVQPQMAAQPQPQVIYVQQPVPQAAPQPAPAPQPKKKKPPIALFVILGILLTLGLIVLVVVIIVVSVAIKAGKEIKGKVSDYGKTQMESIIDDAVDEFDPFAEFTDTSKDTTTGKDTVKLPDNDTEGGKETDPAGNTVEPDGDIGQFGTNTANWDSVGRPVLADFTWYYNGEYDYREGVTWLDSSEYQGKWKGMIIYSADGSEELVNFDLNINPDNATLLTDWYMLNSSGNEIIPEEDMEDTLFVGYEWGSGILVEMEGNSSAQIQIDEFWERGGTQYGFGTLAIPGSDNNRVLLVRP